jgi:hypothetical protein
MTGPWPRLRRDDEISFRVALDHWSGDPTAGFAASILSLSGLIGEIDHLRAEVARLSGPEPTNAADTPDAPMPWDRSRLHRDRSRL